MLVLCTICLRRSCWVFQEVHVNLYLRTPHMTPSGVGLKLLSYFKLRRHVIFVRLSRRRVSGREQRRFSARFNVWRGTLGGTRLFSRARDSYGKVVFQPFVCHNGPNFNGTRRHECDVYIASIELATIMTRAVASHPALDTIVSAYGVNELDFWVIIVNLYKHTIVCHRYHNSGRRTNLIVHSYKLGLRSLLKALKS